MPTSEVSALPAGEVFIIYITKAHPPLRVLHFFVKHHSTRCNSGGKEETKGKKLKTMNSGYAYMTTN